MADEKQELSPEQQRLEFQKQQQQEREKEMVDTAVEPKGSRYSGGKLTRSGMEAAIREGGSVMVTVPVTEDSPATTRKIVSKVEDLPDDAVLTKGDAAASQAALDAIDAEAAQLAARRAAVQKTHERTVAESKKTESSKTEQQEAERKRLEQEEAERQAAAKHPRR